MNYRYKKAGVWLCRREEWQIREWHDNGNEGLPPDGIVDCISFGSLMAIAFDDYDVLEVHADLLLLGIRWPPELTPPGKMRSITSLTWDPYMAHYFACWKLNRLQMAEVVKPPIWLRRPYRMLWRSYALKPRKITK